MIYYLDETAKKLIDSVVRRVLNLRGGPGIRVMNTPEGITISSYGPPPATVIGGGDNSFPARIVSSALVSGSHIRWKYTLQRGAFTPPGTPGDPPTWTDDSSATISAYNACEVPNTATSGTVVVGCGVHVDAADGTVNGTTCVLQPIGNGSIVTVRGFGGAYVFDAISNSAE